VRKFVDLKVGPDGGKGEKKGKGRDGKKKKKTRSKKRGTSVHRLGRGPARRDTRAGGSLGRKSMRQTQGLAAKTQVHRAQVDLKTGTKESVR